MPIAAGSQNTAFAPSTVATLSLPRIGGGSAEAERGAASRSAASGQPRRVVAIAIRRSTLLRDRHADPRAVRPQRAGGTAWLPRDADAAAVQDQPVGEDRPLLA